MSEALPKLRRDVDLIPSPDGEGALLHDPIAGQWHRLDDTAVRVLGAWAGDRSHLARKLPNVDPEKIDATIEYLRRNGLTVSHRTIDPSKGPQGALSRVLHGYLFVRIPLGNPSAILDATLPLAGFLAGRATRFALIALLALTLVLVAKRSHEIVPAFAAAWSSDHAVVVMLALALAKIVHEAGHAYATRLKGAVVRSVGVAFMVMYPVLYTDTTDAWRLPHRDRLAIDLAGVIAELALGTLAAFAWTILPDGDLRTGAFVLAFVAWISSLAVNLNPFMRFDGYHALADALNMPNLQPRAFALARWRIREWLFAYGEPAPEALPLGKRRLVIAYAVGTWVYRLFLFVGIALLVYHIAFKALGVLLFVVEIAYFVVRPIRAEVAVWWERKGDVRRRLFWPGLVLCACAAILFAPLDSTVRAPAMLERESFTVRAPSDGQLRPLAGDRVVRAGQRLATIESHERALAVEVAAAELRRARAVLARTVAKPGERNALPIREAQLRDATVALDVATGRVLGSVIMAPSHGRFEPRREVWTSRSVATGDHLGDLVTERMIVRAYIREAELGRLPERTQGTFYPARPMQKDVAVADGYRIALGRTIRDATLLRSNGGPLRGRWDGKEVVLDATVATIKFTVDHALATDQGRGTVHIPAERRSLAGRALRHLIGLTIRESGF